MSTPNLIPDHIRLVGAKHHGYDIATYDDGYGNTFIHRDSTGILGIVRAQTWNDAYKICEDEFFPEASETVEELRKEYNVHRRHVKIIKNKLSGAETEATKEHYHETTGRLLEDFWEFVRHDTIETPVQEGEEDCWTENELFQEAYGFRPNGRRSVGPDGKDRDPIGHGIYSKDLNGDLLDLLTPELLRDLEIDLILESEDRPEQPQLAGIKHDLQQAKDRLFCARWDAVKIARFEAGDVADLDAKLAEIETDIHELRVTLGLRVPQAHQPRRYKYNVFDGITLDFICAVESTKPIPPGRCYDPRINGNGNAVWQEA